MFNDLKHTNLKAPQKIKRTINSILIFSSIIFLYPFTTLAQNTNLPPQQDKSNFIFETKKHIKQLTRSFEEIKTSLEEKTDKLLWLEKEFNSNVITHTGYNLNSLRKKFLSLIDNNDGFSFDRFRALDKAIGEDSQLNQYLMQSIGFIEERRPDLIKILYGLRQVSSQIQETSLMVSAMMDELKKSKNNHGALKNKLVKIGLEKTESLAHKLEEAMSAQVAKADELHEIFELVLRKKWSSIYDQNKVIDRFFIANSPLENSIFMLKAGTQGIIREIKEVPLFDEVTGTSTSKTYYLKVDFELYSSQAMANKMNFLDGLWIEYDPQQNHELNLIRFKNGVNLPEEIRVGDEMIAQVDGVTAFTEDPTKETETVNSQTLVPSAKIVKIQKISNDPSSLSSVKREVAQKQKILQSRAGHLMTVANGFAASCQEYIRKNNQFGSIGQSVMKNITPRTAPVLYADHIGDLKINPKRICPKYSQFSQNQKVDFLVYYAAAIGMAESSCNSRIKARGPNGTLIGQWQLHLGKTHQYANGACGKINPHQGDQNVVCGLKMLNFYTGMAKNTLKELFYKGNYWETMHYPRPGAKKALRLIHKFPGCY